MQLKEIKKYYSNGKVGHHYFHDEQKRKQGKYIVYYDGNISFEVNFKDDKPHGKYIEYNSNDAINYIEYYWHGEKVTKAEFLKLKYDEAMKCS